VISGMPRIVDEIQPVEIGYPWGKVETVPVA
jgi:hypothetical protein